MEIKEEINLIRKQSLMMGLNDEELLKIYNLAKKQEFLNNEIIIEEDELSSDLYLVVEGEVSILKWDEDHFFQLPVTKLAAGQMFGEMSFLDFSPRSSSVKTIKKTTVWQLSRKDIDWTQPDMQLIFNKLMSNIALINMDRLRSSNTILVKTLRSSLRQLQERTDKGKIVIFLILLFGLANLLTAFSTYYSISDDSNLFLLGYWLLVSLPIIYVIRKFFRNFNSFGFETGFLKPSLLNSLYIILGSIPIFVIINYTGLSSIFFKYPYANHALNPLVICSYFFYCVIKEFIARGILQSSLQDLLEDKKGWITPLLSSCLIVLLPSLPHWPAQSTFIPFCFNVLLGRIYFQQRHLIGVILIHFFWGLLLMIS